MLQLNALVFFFQKLLIRKYSDGSWIYEEWNEQWIKPECFSKYMLCSNSIETKAEFTQTEINNEWNVNIIQNTRYAQRVSRRKHEIVSIQKSTMNETLIVIKIVEASFSFVEGSLNLLFWNGVKQCRCISLNFLHFRILFLSWVFSLGKKKKRSQ